MELQRATDRDRDDAVTALRDGYASGALTLDELVARVERALVATTRSDLAELSVDLARPDVPARTNRNILVMFGSNKLSGRWRLGPLTTISVLFGACKVDLGQAEVTPGAGDVVELRSVVFCGTVKIRVPRGVRVEIEGSPLFGTHKVVVRGPETPGLPVVRVRASSIFGTLKVRDG